MGVQQPISLLRLRSATAAFKAILEGSLVELEVLAELYDPPSVERAPRRELLEAVQTSLDNSHGGGVADILRRVESVLGDG